jgi:5-methylcytosine-specific restriction endonuclease McrA
METLVLDYTWQPIDRISWMDAMVNWANEKVEIIATYADRIVHQGLELYMPAVVRFMKPTGKRKRVIRFSRENVLLRDRYTCQYCGSRVSRRTAQYEHVVPRAKGGKTTWTNIVISCHDCNQCKSHRDHTCGRSNCKSCGGRRRPMRPRNDPVKPKTLPPRLNPRLIWQDGLPDTWRPFLPTRDQVASYAYWHGELEE